MLSPLYKRRGGEWDAEQPAEPAGEPELCAGARCLAAKPVCGAHGGLCRGRQRLAGAVPVVNGSRAVAVRALWRPAELPGDGSWTPGAGLRHLSFTPVLSTREQSASSSAYFS